MIIFHKRKKLICFVFIKGNVKIGVIVACSMVVFGDHKDFSARNWAGINQAHHPIPLISLLGAFISLLGFTTYSVVKYRQIKNHRKNQKLLDQLSAPDIDENELDDETSVQLITLMDQ